MPKNADSHIQNSAPGPPVEIAPVTPMMLPGPTRIAVLSRKEEAGEMPAFAEERVVTVFTAFLKWVT